MPPFVFEPRGVLVELHDSGSGLLTAPTVTLHNVAEGGVTYSNLFIAWLTVALSVLVFHSA